MAEAAKQRAYVGDDLVADQSKASPQGQLGQPFDAASPRHCRCRKAYLYRHRLFACPYFQAISHAARQPTSPTCGVTRPYVHSTVQAPAACSQHKPKSFEMALTEGKCKILSAFSCAVPSKRPRSGLTEAVMVKILSFVLLPLICIYAGICWTGSLVCLPHH